MTSDLTKEWPVPLQNCPITNYPLLFCEGKIVGYVEFDKEINKNRFFLDNEEKFLKQYNLSSVEQIRDNFFINVALHNKKNIVTTIGLSLQLKSSLSK